MMNIVKRKKNKTATEDMVNVRTDYLRDVCHMQKLNMSELSIVMGYCPDYISNAITDGRMNKEHLKMLASLLEFSYKDALVRKGRRSH